MHKTDGPTTVWMIHGTWARSASWTRSGSALESAMRKQLPDDINVRRFEWTGRNRHKDRTSAASQLVTTIRAETTSGHHLAIAHSHGGNIALHAALTDPQLFDGIVTLNTPFLTAVPRNHFVVWLMLGLIAITLNSLVLALAAEFQGSGLSLAQRLVVQAIFAIPFIAMAMWVLRPYGRQIETSIWSEPSPTASSERPHRTRILCVNYADDEAVGWLGAVDTFSNLPTLILHRVALPATLCGIALAHYVFQWEISGPVILFNIRTLVSAYGEIVGEETARNFVAGLTLQLTPENVATLSHFVWDGAPTRLFALVFAESVLSYFVTFWGCVGVAAFVSAYLTRAVFLGQGFGRDAIAGAWLTRIIVSSTPMVPCDLDVLTVTSERSWGLRHSDAYSNPLVTRRILSWLKQRVEQRPLEL